MTRPASKTSALRLLPALLLAVFLGAQVELVGHMHADDGFVGDCLQCQFDQGHAALSAGAVAPRFSSGGIDASSPVSAPYLSGIYRLPARGPPTLF